MINRSYRHKGWKNPYSDPHWNDDGEVSGMEEGIYESGADDMRVGIIEEIKGMLLPYPLREDTSNGNVANFMRRAILKILEGG